jgi:CheY-like chemotaxis protein
LLAEDHDANRQVITLRLNSMGAEVVPARNGKEALEQVRDAAEQGRPFDAVIMDMEMPVLDGYEAVRQLRAGGFTSPILAVTAYAMSKDREECLNLGCDEHISKPIEWDNFFRMLIRLLGARNGTPAVTDTTVARAE